MNHKGKNLRKTRVREMFILLITVSYLVIAYLILNVLAAEPAAEPEAMNTLAYSLAENEAVLPLSYSTGHEGYIETSANETATSMASNWKLKLVNAQNPLDSGYIPELETLPNGLQFDSRGISQLNEMLAAAKAEGLSPIVCSAYRSIEKQTSLFNNQVEREMSKGLSREQAEAEAAKAVAAPGTSEHNLGLAADIVSVNYQLLNDEQANTPEVKWLLEHCAEYGFILRYPKDKTDITGVMYEPWHFRYVGKEAATEIMQKGICLEEYI